MCLLRGALCESRSRIVELIEVSTIWKVAGQRRWRNVNSGPNTNEVVEPEIFRDSVVGSVIRARLMVR